MSELHRALIGNASIEIVRSLLSEMNVNECGPNRQTPVHLATRHTDALALLPMMISLGGNVSAKDSDGETPLHLATRGKSDENLRKNVLEYLIDQGADINAIDYDGNTPLHSAAEYGEAIIIATLVDYGAKVNITNKKGKTPYELADNVEKKHLLNDSKPVHESEKIAEEQDFYDTKTPLPSLANDILVTLRRFRTFCPVTARIRVHKEKCGEIVYYISRGASVGDIASYYAPIGQLASKPLGRHEIKLPADGKGREFHNVTFDLLEKASINPVELTKDWDSKPTIVTNDRFGPPLTIESLQVFLKDLAAKKIDVAAQAPAPSPDKIFSKPPEKVSHDDKKIDTPQEVLSPPPKKIRPMRPMRPASIETPAVSQPSPSILESTNVFEGLRRNVITKMELRDQPILDQYQDEIFRLPLSKKLLITGPPGTGKTTTLIRRLGQKIDPQYSDYLPDSERRIVEEAEKTQNIPHKKSWLMFTPTELLKQYLKEAFAREGVPASDLNIYTWEKFRRQLGREVFKILKTPIYDGGYVLREKLNILKPGIEEQLTLWYEDFENWFRTRFTNAFISEVKKLIQKLQLSETLEENRNNLDKINRLLEKKKSSGALGMDQLLKNQMESRQNDIVQLQTHLNKLLSIDPQSSFEQIVEHVNRANSLKSRIDSTAKEINTSIAQAFVIENHAIRTLAPIPPLQSFFKNPLYIYLATISNNYRNFRKIRQSESKWYHNIDFDKDHIHPLELDMILLMYLRAINHLFLSVGYDKSSKWSTLLSYSKVFRNQILVDEATDFSPIQLACMESLAHPRLRSFFACGDFNQRITTWGTGSLEHLKWASPDIEIRNVNIAYRQSQQLNALATDMIRETNGIKQHVDLPAHVDNSGVPPALLENASEKDVIPWLANRICEIECFVKQFPSTAIFVNSEAEVGQMATSLGKALEDYNIQVTACYAGQTVGQDSNVRVFDIQHIKGLEFEAVFFTNLDSLAEVYPNLFDKFLYVGTTRAATYLGITCQKKLPPVIEKLRRHFGSNWETKGS